MCTHSSLRGGTGWGFGGVWHLKSCNSEHNRALNTYSALADGQKFVTLVVKKISPYPAQILFSSISTYDQSKISKSAYGPHPLTHFPIGDQLVANRYKKTPELAFLRNFKKLIPTYSATYEKRTALDFFLK
jgi:hypothetical protein